MVRRQYVRCPQTTRRSLRWTMTCVVTKLVPGTVAVLPHLKRSARQAMLSMWMITLRRLSVRVSQEHRVRRGVRLKVTQVARLAGIRAHACAARASYAALPNKHVTWKRRVNCIIIRAWTVYTGTYGVASTTLMQQCDKVGAPGNKACV